MEETPERKECTHEGSTYIHGSELCLLDKCMTCKNGEWIEKKFYGPFDPVP